MNYGHSFAPNWEHGYEAGVEATSGIGAFILIFLMAFAIIMVAVAIAVYVLQSVSLYAIAKRRGIKNPWLSWLPVGNMWVMGCIADQYQYVAKGKVKKRRNVLLVLTIALYALCLINGMCKLCIPISGIVGSRALSAALVAFSLYSSIALVVVNLVAMVYQYIAMYDLYASCDPDNAVAFLILSIVLPISYPVLFFLVKNKDKGMPPRRVRTVYEAAQESVFTQPQQLPESTEE